MNPDSPPLVAPTEELAPEAMINEGGAISQPQIPAKLAAMVRRPHLERLLGAFAVGLLIGWALSRE